MQFRRIGNLAATKNMQSDASETFLQLRIYNSDASETFLQLRIYNSDASETFLKLRIYNSDASDCIFQPCGILSDASDCIFQPCGILSDASDSPRSAQAVFCVACIRKNSGFAPACKAVSIGKEQQVMVLIFTGRDFSLGVTERAKLELCHYFRRRLEPAPSGV
jgi:hypothetical protein